MNKRYQITRQDLLSLEQYDEQRSEIRRKVLAHKKNRQVMLGPDATLYFEDRLTLLYQIQEMLRIEKIFKVEGINDELEVYNPMIPSGRNFKATFMIEYTNAEIRATQLELLVGIEDLIWMQVAELEKVWAIADEDLDRSTDTKTSAVHFVRFEMTDEMARALKNGAELVIGVKHPAYTYHMTPESITRNSLLNDLN